MYTVGITHRPLGITATTFSCETFETEGEARDFCREEVKWESCQRVECDELGIDETGDFT